MQRISTSAMFTVFIGLGIAAMAQTPNQRTPPAQQPDQSQQNEQAGGQPMTLTGCLMKGTQPQEYAITDSKSGEKISFPAPDQLQTYVNQTVQLVGSVTMKGGQKAFHPESVKAIASTCERPK